ncbi:MAG: hypothetical protein AB2770_06635 [Candidatus Thiodiazotropha taylori]
MNRSATQDVHDTGVVVSAESGFMVSLLDGFGIRFGESVRVMSQLI